MDSKKIAILKILLVFVVFFVDQALAVTKIRYDDLPRLVRSSPLLLPDKYRLKELEAHLQSLSLENGWWLSLSGTYYFNQSYAEDIIGYTLGFSLKFEKAFGGYTSSRLLQEFFTRLDYLRNDLSREERRKWLLWKARFLFVEDLLLGQKIKVLEDLERTTREFLLPAKARMLAGFGRAQDIALYADRLFRYRLEKGLLREQRKKIRMMLSMILGLEEVSPEGRPLWVRLPVEMPSPEAPSLLQRAAGDLTRLSKRRFYPRFKFSLGADRTWNDSSGSLWTGFSVSIPLHFQRAEEARQEEVYALWERLKKEEEVREEALKRRAFEHLMGLLSTRLEELLAERRFETGLLESRGEKKDPLDPFKEKMAYLAALGDYFDAQIRLFTLLASLGSTLQLENLPPSGEEVLFGLPPRELAAWWWESGEHPEKVKELSTQWPLLRRLYFSLNQEQIKRYLQGQDEGLSRTILSLYEKGFEIEILLGEPTWILPQPRRGLKRLLRLIEARLFPLVSLVHLDLEPWSLPAFKEAREELLRLYLETLEELQKETSLGLVVDVPLFFFREELLWRGKKASIIEHVLPLVNGVVVMNYLGDPLLFLKKAHEISDFLSSRKIPFWIGLSIEKDVSPEESFQGFSTEELRTFLQKILTELSPSYFFRGVAIERFKELENYASSPHSP